MAKTKIQKNQNPNQKQKKQNNASKARAQNKVVENVFGNSRNYQAPLAPVRRQRRRSNLQLSKCALKYALAISDPFHPSARNACLPVFPSVPSQKVTAFSRFTMQIGTGGTGFVAVSPTLANNTVATFYSNASFVGTALNLTTASNTLTLGVSSGFLPNIPYNAADLAGGIANGALNISGRIVSCGLRVTYTGTTMNESGVYYAFVDPNHMNVTTIANNTGQIGAHAAGDVCGTTRESCSIEMYPVSPTETEFSGSSTGSSTMLYTHPYSNNDDVLTPSQPTWTFTAGGYKTGSPCGVIFVTGVAGSTYLCELIEHIEYQGTAAAGACTPSDADQRGFEIVTAAASRLPQLKSTNHDKKSIPALLVDGIQEVMSSLQPVAIDFLTKGAMAMFM